MSDFFELKLVHSSGCFPFARNLESCPLGQMHQFTLPELIPAGEIAVLVVSMIPEFPQREQREPST